MYFSGKISFDISCELSAMQTIHMKCQTLLSENNKKKNQNAVYCSCDWRFKGCNPENCESCVGLTRFQIKDKIFIWNKITYILLSTKAFFVYQFKPLFRADSNVIPGFLGEINKIHMESQSAYLVGSMELEWYWFILLSLINLYSAADDTLAVNTLKHFSFP